MKKRKLGRKLLSFLLTLALVLGLMPGMGLTAYADNTETLLTTITATGKEQANYSTANVATVSFSYTAGGSSAYLANWGWWGYGWTATVNAAEGYTITKCVFYDDANRTATDSSSPFVVETTEEDKTPRINGTPIDGGNFQSKGLKKIEVYGYVTPASSYSVTITAGDHMTKTAGSGDAEQTGLTGAMTDVVYTADNGYYYPTDYSVAEVSGIKVTRDSYTQITVSGTPSADATITLTAPTAKTTPAAPTTAASTDCTTADNNDGKLTGVTAAMEYKKSDAADWMAGTGSDITGLVPGTYYVRLKATDTTTASDNQELTIAAYQKESAVVTEAPAAKSLTYNGQAQELVTAGTATGGEMQYALGTATEATQSYTASIPTGTDAGTYYVWYKAKGNAGYTDSDPKCLTAKIAKESGGSTAVVTQKPEAKSDLVESDSAQTLVTTGKAENGTMQYAPGKDENTAPSDGWSSDVPKETAAGTYYVWYKAKGNDGYSDSDPVCVTVKIAKKGEEPSGDTPSDSSSSSSDSSSSSSSSDSGSSSSSSSNSPAPQPAATAQVSGRGGAKTTETLKQEYVNAPVQANSAAAALGITDMGAAIDSLSNPVAKTNLVTAAVNLGNVDIGTSQTTPATASVGLATDKVTALLAVLTPEELVGVVTGNANVKVDMVLSDAQQAAVSPQVQNAIQAASGPVSGLYYMNMDLFVVTNNGTPQAVTEFNGMLPLTFVIPTSLRANGRSYSMVLSHTNMATGALETAVLPDMDIDPNTYTTQTDKLCVMAIAYTDGAGAGTQAGAQAGAPTSASKSIARPASGAPKTGEDGTLAMLLLCAIGLGITLVATRKKYF